MPDYWYNIEWLDTQTGIKGVDSIIVVADNEEKAESDMNYYLDMQYPDDEFSVAVELTYTEGLNDD